MISRRDDESVPIGTPRRSNKEISHFLASQRAGEFGQSSLLLVPHIINYVWDSSLTYLKIRIAPRALNLARIHSAKLILFGSCTPI